MSQSFEELLERKKKIYQTAWDTFIYLLKNRIDPTPENYKKFFERFFNEPSREENPVWRVIKKTDKVLDTTHKSLDELEEDIRQLPKESEFDNFVEKLLLKIEQDKHLIEDLQEEIRKLEDELETVKREKYIDPLTGVWNRYALEEFLEILPKLSMERNIVVAFIDLNKFKQINDTYGHIVGDRVLKHFAKYLKENLKRKDFIARFGGDEFVAVLFDIDLDDAKRLFEKLRKDIPPVKINGKEIKVDFCVGLTVPFGSDKPEEIITRADAAMYRCKKTKNVEIQLK